MAWKVVRMGDGCVLRGRVLERSRDAVRQTVARQAGHAARADLCRGTAIASEGARIATCRAMAARWALLTKDPCKGSCGV